MKTSLYRTILAVLLIAIGGESFAQQVNVGDSLTLPKEQKFHYTELILPSVLIGVGIIGLESKWLQYQNGEIRDELQENIDKQITMDDFTQYLPSVAVYGLNLCGLKGKHNFRDRTVILATSYLIMGATVNVLKHTTREERPDNSAFNSFPSGHTATAFMGAEFLWQEYREVSPWIGVAGFAIATGTGMFRMYNDRHWMTDVLSGAGIGILSTKMAYWLHPWMQRHLFKKKSDKSALALPYYNGHSVGLAFHVSF